jgi:hypothetical protein
VLNLVVYLPGVGGNHLKNLLCLSSSYANSSDLQPEVYENPDPRRPLGEVWCVGGRNLQDIFFERMDHQNNSTWILAAHLGEMFQYQAQLEQINNKKIIVVSLDDDASRRQLDCRQQRLGQTIHPYWLDEELVWLYHPDVLSKIFSKSNDQYFCLPIKTFWNKNFVASNTFDQLTQFLNIDFDRVTADHYHHLWHKANKFV